MNKDKKRKIIVTGASGFLGSNLIESLTREKGYFVYALSSRGDELQKKNIKKNIRYYCKDIIFFNGSEQILNNSIVVNCAFPRNTSGTEIADGLRYIQKLFDKSGEYGAKAVINISSQSVYSQVRKKVATEETSVSLESPYAVGKYATELMLESACKKNSIPYTNLRMASLIGPEFDQRIVNRLVKQAIAGKTLRVVRSNQKFGFLDIDDAVNALIAVLEKEITKWKPVYNIGNGREYSVEYIVRHIKNIFEINGLPFPNINIDFSNDFGNTGVAYKQLHDDTGFEPIIDLDNSIKKILKHIQEYKYDFKDS